MMWLKCCPRCGGDLYDNQDVYGDYIACVQCGHYLESVEELAIRKGFQVTMSPGVNSLRTPQPVPLHDHSLTTNTTAA